MTKPPTTKVGKSNSLFWALVVAGFLTWQTLAISYSREEGLTVKTQPIPLNILAPCLVFIALAVGINIRDELAILASLVNRNSAAINQLQPNNIQETIEHSVKEAVEEALHKEEILPEDNDKSS
jgi:hypothetical protein